MALLTKAQLEKIHTEVCEGEDQLDVMDYLMDVVLEVGATMQEKEAFFLGYVACVEYTRFIVDKIRGRNKSE